MTKEEEIELGGQASEADKEVQFWGQPIPFESIETPDIPASLLPTWLGEYAEAVSKTTQTPPGLAVMMVLSVVSTCLQKRYRVSVYPDYSEPVNIWAITVLPPATRKTAVVTAATDVVCDWERDEAARLADEIANNEAIRSVNQKRIDRLNKKAADEDDPTERRVIIHDVAELQKDTPDEMKAPRLWTTDVTPERLQNLLAEHGERMGVLSDEGGIFEVMAGLYSNGHANIDVFLKAHAGSPVRVDRGQREAWLQQPALTFGLTVQPDVISDLAVGAKKKFRGRGALARFLYCVPASNIGCRDVLKHKSIPANVLQAYTSGIRSLLTIPIQRNSEELEQPRVLRLTKDAMDAWQKFAAYIEANQGRGKPFESFQDWTGKLPGTALRVAGLCHVVEHGSEDFTISLNTIERALDLCQLLIPHAQCAFDMLGANREISNAKYLLRWIKGRTMFTQRDCHKMHIGRFPRVAEIKEALAVLTERNLISDPISHRPDGGGRPSIWFEVNPAVFPGGE